jgi:hypothetical protein
MLSGAKQGTMTSKIHNPYASKGRKISNDASTLSSATGAGNMPLSSAGARGQSSHIMPLHAPNNASLDPSPLNTTTVVPSPLSKNISLRAKLKKDIENLKRQKLLQKQRLELEKQKNYADKQRRRLEKKELAAAVHEVKENGSTKQTVGEALNIAAALQVAAPALHPIVLPTPSKVDSAAVDRNAMITPSPPTEKLSLGEPVTNPCSSVAWTGLAPVATLSSKESSTQTHRSNTVYQRHANHSPTTQSELSSSTTHTTMPYNIAHQRETPVAVFDNSHMPTTATQTVALPTAPSLHCSIQQPEVDSWFASSAQHALTALHMAQQPMACNVHSPYLNSTVFPGHQLHPCHVHVTNPFNAINSLNCLDKGGSMPVFPNRYSLPLLNNTGWPYQQALWPTFPTTTRLDPAMNPALSYPFFHSFPAPGLYAPQQSVQQPRPKRQQPTRTSLPKNHHAPSDLLLLTPTPCRHPSPYQFTHTQWPHTLHLTKQHAGQGFGITVQRHVESALVAPNEWPRKGESSSLPVSSSEHERRASVVDDDDDAPAEHSVDRAIVSAELVSTGAKQIVVRKPVRRRRILFAVLQVVDPSEQNNRQHPQGKKTGTIQTGDLLLTINGKETANLTFEHACALFAECNMADADGHICCEVTVARRKPHPQKVESLDHHKQMPTPDRSRFRTDPLGPSEIYSLAKSVVQAAIDPRPIVEQSSLHDWTKDLQQTRMFDALQKSWSDITRHIEDIMLDRALEHWKKEWELQPAEIRQASGKVLVTDAQRSVLRARPRPPKGCRCGSQDHEYATDPLCLLYSNVRRLDESVDDEQAVMRTLDITSRLPNDMNVVEKAFTDRIVRIKGEEWANEAEVDFVRRMEELLLHKCNKAIQAPSLTAIVLSAVAELAPNFKDRKASFATSNIAREAPVEAVDHDSDDISDDDDVPLTALGKRSSKVDQEVPNKKVRAAAALSYDYIAALLLFVSNRWGHVYREPCHEDYTWRWEVHHGQVVSGGTKLDSTSNFKNPRRQGALSLENLRFLLTEEMVTLLPGLEINQGSIEAMKSLAYAVAPSTSGVLDELHALAHSEIVGINEAGIPVLSEDWFLRVDLLLLDDMDSFWSLDIDPTGRYGISDYIRSTLNITWKKNQFGWALVEEPDSIIFDFGTFDEWRVAFEDHQQSKVDSTEGVGRFGI